LRKRNEEIKEKRGKVVDEIEEKSIHTYFFFLGAHKWASLCHLEKQLGNP